MNRQTLVTALSITVVLLICYLSVDWWVRHSRHPGAQGSAVPSGAVPGPVPTPTISAEPLPSTVPIEPQLDPRQELEAAAGSWQAPDGLVVVRQAGTENPSLYPWQVTGPSIDCGVFEARHGLGWRTAYCTENPNTQRIAQRLWLEVRQGKLSLRVAAVNLVDLARAK